VDGFLSARLGGWTYPFGSAMVYCIGVDEAGYGPRLGPLVISASVWELPSGLKPEQMYHLLSRLIVAQPPQTGNRCRSGALGTDRPPQPGRFRRSEGRSAQSTKSANSANPSDFAHSVDFIHYVDFAHSIDFALPDGSVPPVDAISPVDFANPTDPHSPRSFEDVPRAWPGGTTPPRSGSHSNQPPKEFLPLVVADSKLVYRRLGRAGLERTVLVMLAGTGKRATDWAELVEAVAFDPESQAAALAWYDSYWPRVPESLPADQIASLAEWVAHGMAEQGIRLVGLWSVLVFPERFNRLVQDSGNKATMLSYQSLELVRGILATLPGGPVQVVCDKHGGRDKYEHLLAETFATSFLQPARVKPIQQTRKESIYQVETTTGSVDFRFLCGGEAMMPVALASMLSKYLRELAMEAWNRFWAEQVPGIRPTAGYPLDARRFRAEIAVRQAALGIPESAIWRCR
jgi:hypothetical protein